MEEGEGMGERREGGKEEKVEGREKTEEGEEEGQGGGGARGKVRQAGSSSARVGTAAVPSGPVPGFRHRHQHPSGSRGYSSR